MTRRLVAVVAVVAAALAAVVVAPAPAMADPTQDVSAFVTANAGDVTTLSPTTAGVTYRVTVRGVYRHDGTRLADCGHVNSGGAALTTAYVPVTNLYVDGSPAPCGGAGVADDHSYAWDVSGTGAPLRLRLVAPADAAGGLAVSVAAHTVTAECTFSVTGLPNSTNVLVSIRASATADGASDVAVTSVRCTVGNSYGEEVVAQTMVPGPRAVIVAEGILRSSTFTPCVEASATWVLGLREVPYGDCQGVSHTGPNVAVPPPTNVARAS